MNPITGPYTKVVGDPNGNRVVTTSSRQKRPYNLLLPFDRSERFCSWPPEAYLWEAHASFVDTSRAYAQAYERLVGKLGNTASLGVTLAQWREADQMISARALQLARFTSAVLRRDLSGAAKTLGISARNIRQTVGKKYATSGKLSDLWLEFWFGWKPAVSDIYSACEVFDEAVPPARIKGKGFSSDTLKLGNWNPADAPHGVTRTQLTTTCRVAIGVDVRLVNPNLHLMNQFGVLNPAVIAFEVIPWSFLLGWVTNVNSWLRSQTDFAGLETSNGYISTSRKAEGSKYWTAFTPPGVPTLSSGRGRLSVRTLMSTPPRPSMAWTGFSATPTRALTAIALLSQKLKRI